MNSEVPNKQPTSVLLSFIENDCGERWKKNCPWWISIVDKYFLVTPLNIAIACFNGCSRSFQECVKHVQYLLYMAMCREPYILFVCSKVAFVNLRTVPFYYWRPDKPLLIQESFWFVKCRGIMRIHRSPSRPRPAVRPTAVLINIHEHLI